jgi:hypothetical protein
MKTIQIGGLFFPFNGNTLINITKQYDNIKVSVSSLPLNLQTDYTYNFIEMYLGTVDRVYLCILNIFQEFFVSEDSFLKIPCEIFEDFSRDIKLAKKVCIENISYEKYSSKNLNWKDSFKNLKLSKISLALNPNIYNEIWEEILESVGISKDKENITPEECGKIKEFYETS